MKKLAAFDLDRTLLNKEGTLSEENRKALLTAINKGVCVCISTGRAFDTIPDELLTFPGIEYAITSNGAAIYRIQGKELLRSLTLPKATVEAVLKVTKKFSVTYEAFIHGTAFGNRDYVADPVRFGATEQAVQYIQTTRHVVDDIVMFLKAHAQELDSMDVITMDEAQKEQVMEAIRKAVPDAYVTSSVKQLVEISHHDGGKGNGLKFLAELLKYARADVYAFGDADNDIDMLEYAGCGIAMGNASPRLLEVADFITKHHDEDGVAYAMCQLKLC